MQFPESKEYIIDYMKKSRNEAMFQEILSLIMNSAISDKEAFFDFVEITIQNVDKIDKKVLRSNLMGISSKYLQHFVKNRKNIKETNKSSGTEENYSMSDDETKLIFKGK